MLCPVCKADPLQPTTLVDGPQTYACPTCQGHWMTADDYWLWSEQQGAPLPEKAPSGQLPTPTEDEHTRRAKLCPSCDRILIKYRIHPDLNFRLDHCAHCGGIWFDHQEWDALRDRHLHDEVYQLITPHKQKQLTQENSRRHFEQLYQARFGTEDYAELRRIKQWLWRHPNRQDLLTYLNDETANIV